MRFKNLSIKYLLSVLFSLSFLETIKKSPGNLKNLKASEALDKKKKDPRVRVKTFIPIQEAISSTLSEEPNTLKTSSSENPIVRSSQIIRSIIELWRSSVSFENIMLQSTNTKRMALINAMNDKPEKAGALTVDLLGLGQHYIMRERKDKGQDIGLKDVVRIDVNLDIYRIVTTFIGKNIQKAEELEKTIEANAKKFQNLLDDLIIPFMENYLNIISLEQMYLESVYVYENMLAKAKIEGRETSLADIKAEIHRNEKNMQLAKYKHQIFLSTMQQNFDPAAIEAFMKHCNQQSIGISKVPTVHVPVPHSVRRAILDMQKHRTSSFPCPDLGASVSLRSKKDFGDFHFRNIRDVEEWKKAIDFSPGLNMQFTFAGALRKVLGVDSRTAEILQNEIRLAYLNSMNSLEALTAEGNTKLATLENLTAVADMHYQNYSDDKLRHQLGGLNVNRETVSIEKVHDSFKQYMRARQEANQATIDFLKTAFKLIREQGALDEMLAKCLIAGEGKYKKISL